MRRFLVLAVAVTAALAFVHAQNTVTYILLNGDRIVGAIASRSDPSPAMPRGELNLERANGEELNFGQEQVAVIDYVGGTPSQREIDGLPADENDHMIAFRDGNYRHGRLVDLRPQLVRWLDTGRTEVFAVDTVARIYLNPVRARAIFETRPGRGAQPGGRAGRGTPGWRGNEAGPIVVPATEAWTDTGLNVREGERLRFTPTGEIRVGPRQTATASGTGGMPNIGFPVPRVPIGALIGKVGDDRAFPIGASGDPIEMNSTGRLWLGINDRTFGDNRGEFRVEVRRETRR
jgi:hypothetical protein